MLLRALLFALLPFLLAACTVAPRFPVDVATAVNRTPMRVLRSDNVDLYYPAGLEREAEALARRAEGCAFLLRAFTTGKGGLSRERIELIFPALPFNNAFVNTPFNGDFFSVVPTHWNMEITTETGLPPGPGYVVCHELAHYVQAQQTLRSLGGLNRAFGYLVTPQAGLDPWFWEGLATFYEQRLQPGTGRPAWPAWEGMFHAAVAERPVTGGDLSALNRRVHWGNHYLYGSHFIHFLVHTYGEQKLWELIERQGKSFFFPFLVNQRFKRVYEKRLSQLIDEFAVWSARVYPPRERPPRQRVVRELGMNARYARAPDGTEALISDAMDAPTTLTVYAPDGRAIYTRRLVDVLPKRHLVQADTRMISGLSFSRDARSLYFVAVDQGLVFQEARLLRLDLARAKLTTVVENLHGPGGDVSPDGKSYAFVRAAPDGHALALVDLERGDTRVLARLPADVFLAQPRFSPDGSRIVAGIFERAYALAVFDAASGARLETLSLPGKALSDASFVDDQRLLFLGEHEERFQVFTYDLSTRTTRKLSAAPYLALQPRSDGKTVRFLNREGVRYTLDEIAWSDAALEHASSRAPTLISALRFLADGDAATSRDPDAGAGDARAPDAAAEAARDAGADSSANDPASHVDASPTSDAAVAFPAESGGTDANANETPPQEGPTIDPPDVTPAAADTDASDTNVANETNADTAANANLKPDRGEPRVVAGVPSPTPAPPELLLHAVDDGPYRSFPRVLIPSIRAPQVDVASISGFGRAGLYLGGTDALGKHRWGAHVAVQPIAWMWSGGLGYLNTQLAPVTLGVNATQLAFDQWECDDDRDGRPDARSLGCPKLHDRRTQRDLTLSATAPLRTSALTLALHATNDRQPDAIDRSARDRSFSGGTLAFEHRALETTPMSGPRRGYFAALEAALYPEQLGTLRTHVGDLAGQLTLYSPLPLSKRHTLRLHLRARALLHGEAARLLEVGGVQPDTAFHHPDDTRAAHYPGLAPRRRFREPLRGFETLGFAVDRIGIAELRYLYPLIIDRGTATSFSILPAFFLRQIDFELFASAAADDPRRLRTRGHVALGGALSVRLVWLLPLSLSYQLAKRVTDDRALQHLLLVSFQI